MATRPEHSAPPEVYYGEEESKKYTSNSRIIQIQRELALRCVELLNFPDDKPKLILDLGCGSGLSGAVLEEMGHTWLGMDVSRDMLEVAVDRGSEGDVLEGDMGQGFGFRTGVFDGAISVSALQWLCYSLHKGHSAKKRLTVFFHSLYRCLKRGARAALQIYPENPEQLELMTSIAFRCGFSGGLVVDFPNSAKAKKFYLCLFAGVTSAALPKAKTDENENVITVGQRAKKKSGKKERVPMKSKEWIVKKKEQRKAKGLSTKRDSKYTGRKRPDRF